jgi:hypothetical protein
MPGRISKRASILLLGEALEFVVKAFVALDTWSGTKAPHIQLLRLPCPEESKTLRQAGGIAFVTPNLSEAFSHPSWQKFEGAMPELDKINEAAHLRSQVYPVSLVVRVCPKCLRKSRKRSGKVSYLLQELVFGKSSVKRRTIRHDFQKFWCHSCRSSFGLDGRFHGNTNFGWNLTALYFYLISTSQLNLAFNSEPSRGCSIGFFAVHISTGGGAYLKKENRWLLRRNRPEDNGENYCRTPGSSRRDQALPILSGMSQSRANPLAQDLALELGEYGQQTGHGSPDGRR